MSDDKKREMNTSNKYDITLLDGDMLILNNNAYNLSDPPVSVGTGTPQISSSSAALIQSIMDRMYRRESEMPYLFLPWME